MGPSKVVGCNAFLLCRCLQCFGNLMQLIVIAISSLNVYAVVLTYGSSVGRGGLIGLGSFTAIIVFIAIVAMLLWSYWACVYTDPGRVPSNWHPFADDEEADRALADINRISAAFHSADPRRPRYCRKCAAWKPERAHHCSVTGQCILRMDHYCIWVVNCVGLLNYKFFLLFVFYAFLGCLIGTMLLLWPCVVTGAEAPVESTALLMAFVFDLVFTICLGAFLGMHGDMLRSNLTSIELFDYRSVKPWPYDLGSTRANFEDVLGPMGWQWLLPMHGKERARMLVEVALQPRMAAFVDLEEGGVRGSADGFASSQPVLRAGALGVAYAGLSDDLGQELAVVDTL